MKEKNNKGLILAIILLVVALFLSVGYIIYDGYLESSKVEDKEQSKIDDSIISDIKNFPTMNDANVKEHDIYTRLSTAELKTNFKNIVKITDNLKFEYSCDFYNEDEKYCNEISVKLTATNGLSEAIIDLGTTDFEWTSISLYETGEYLIVVEKIGGGVDNVNLLIYDLSGNLKYTSKNAISYYKNSEQDTDGFLVIPTISNDILYFVSAEKGSQDTLKFNYINLNDEILKDKLIQKFKAFFSYEG